MDWGAEYIGTILLTAGAVLALWRNKRQFDRTNQFGVEQFSSFWDKLRSKMKDGLLGGTSLVFLSGGLLVLAFHYQDSWGWVVLVPVFTTLLLVIFLGT